MAVAVAGTPGLRVAGVRSYGGRLYSPMPAEDARELAIAELVELAQAARDITAEGLPCRVVSAGSTPLTAALRPGDVPQEVTEIRAGNYVFYDRMQLQLHSAGVGDVALRLVATIVSVADDHAMVDAGLKSISATKAYADQDIAEIESRPGWRVDAAWEECARVRYPVGERPRAGDRLALIPNHACELPNLAAVVLHGRDDRIAGHYVPAARGEPW
jgi:D-serine deaminase-like pyridoxal phosphate-dependent protein